MAEQSPRAGSLGLTMGALGVVFGDIGTSPLYTLKAVFGGGYGVPVDAAGVLGILSLIAWSLIWVVSFKYALFVMRADSQGEGGVMVLTTLARRALQDRPRLRVGLTLCGLFGAALFYGDSLITPAISVLSAVEGVEIAVESIAHWVIPLTLVILVGIFLLQRQGSARLGLWFGPLMQGWFAVLAVLGVVGILNEPQVLAALNPLWALRFLLEHPGVGLAALGAVVLAFTGVEALYADLGHFGRRPILRAWFWLVFPALLLNYFGQGALLLADAGAIRNPFYLLAPGWALPPLIALATVATVIASQAVITGTFSLTRQLIQLGYVPRMLIRHTSSETPGQIYLPVVNWLLMAGVILLVLEFRRSEALAAAYGLAVTGTMLVTTLLLGALMLSRRQLNPVLAWLLLAGFVTVDGLFLGANLTKVLSGGLLPLVLALGLFLLMTTWKQGRRVLYARLSEMTLPVPDLIDSILRETPQRVKGTAVFLTANPHSVPRALLHNLKHNQVLHERVVLLSVLIRDEPRLPAAQRATVENHGHGFYRILLSFGFMEPPDVPAALRALEIEDVAFPELQTTYYLSRETLIPGRHRHLSRWREGLFIFLHRNAASSLRYFHLPANRVVELGCQVEL